MYQVMVQTLGIVVPNGPDKVGRSFDLCWNERHKTTAYSDKATISQMVQRNVKDGKLRGFGHAEEK